jgi:spermidine synthase
MEWFEEECHPHWRQRLALGPILLHQHTGLQEVLVFDNPTLGRVLVLDGVVQTTACDEFIYHEMLTHVPLVAHGAAQEVLIIGGGDGGALEEVLKHPGVTRATLVELDPRVVEIARTYLAEINRGAFDDPRTELLIADGADFVARSERQFDVIIVDSTDPAGPGEVLFGEAFYAACRARLRPGGILVGQGGNPICEPERFRAAQARLGRVFADASFILSAVPSYLGGPFVIAWGCDQAAKRQLGVAELAARPCPAGLRCYNATVHAAAFAHPPWLAAGAPSG